MATTIADPPKVAERRPTNHQIHSDHVLQRGLLARFRKEETRLVLMLMNDAEITGVIHNYDMYVIDFRDDDGRLYFLYKHGIIGFRTVQTSSVAEAA